MSNNNNNNGKAGSSAQAKLLAEFERDRSIQSDRMRGAATAGEQNFRSLGRPFGTAATGASFDQFQRGQAGLLNSPSTPGPNAGLALASSSPAQWTINRRTGQPVPTSLVHAQTEDWTDEFARLSLGYGQPVARHANGAPLVPYPASNPLHPGEVAAIPGIPEPRTQFYYAPPRTQPTHFLPDVRGDHFPPVGVIAGPTMQPIPQMQMMPSTQHMPMTFMAQQPYQTQFSQQTPTAQERSSAAESGPTHEEIKAYLDAEFEHEMSTWLDSQAADTETTVADGPATSSATQAMSNPTMSSSAQQQAPVASGQTEQQPPTVISNTDLALVAQELVNSVADNTSEKFKNSQFMELIGRIASGEVVVANNNLVPHTQAASAPAQVPAQHVPGHDNGLSTGLPAGLSAGPSEANATKPDYKGKGKAVARPGDYDGSA